MPIRSSATEWSSLVKLFHWTIVLLLLVQATIALSMGELPSSALKVQIYALHKSIGILILALATARIVLRLLAGAPAPVPNTPRAMAVLAALMHWALYALLFVVPLSGWLLNSVEGYPLQFFGLFEVPALVATDYAFADMLEEAHEMAFWLLLTLVLAHAAMALFHHFFKGDDTLRRMLPGDKSRPKLS